LQKHLSQEELAELVEITPTHIKHIESEHRKPSLELLYRLVRTLNLSLDTLIFPEREDAATAKPSG
jgi:transcriptional regulator with XRE-family HTH domain